MATESNDSRQIARDSLFVLAGLRADGQDGDHRIKVRNLSAGGMMGEGAVRVFRGQPVWVDLRNIGWVEGSVAWVQDSRFGVAFRDEIDPRVARAPLAEGEHTPRHIRPPLKTRDPEGVLRKI